MRTLSQVRSRPTTTPRPTDRDTHGSEIDVTTIPSPLSLSHVEVVSSPSHATYVCTRDHPVSSDNVCVVVVVSLPIWCECMVVCVRSFRYISHRYPDPIPRHSPLSTTQPRTGTPGETTWRGDQSIPRGHVLDTTPRGPVGSDETSVRVDLILGPCPVV